MTTVQKNPLSYKNQPVIVPHKEPEPMRERGVFCLKYHRKVLFTKLVTLKTADLPRWKPKIVIDRRTLER